MEDVEERVGEVAAAVAKIGITTGVMRPIERPTSGPKKTFVRFQPGIDRDLLRRGHARRTGNAAIDAFWSEVAEHYPG